MVDLIAAKSRFGIKPGRLNIHHHFKASLIFTFKGYPCVEQVFTGYGIHQPDKTSRFKIAGIVPAFHVIQFFQHLDGQRHIMFLKVFKSIMVVQNDRGI